MDGKHLGLTVGRLQPNGEKQKPSVGKKNHRFPLL